jgi:hypothetical protein
VEFALNHLRGARMDLESGLRRRRRIRMVLTSVSIAERELQQALQQHCDTAPVRLREALLSALGPYVKAGTIIDAVQMLEVLLDSLALERDLRKQIETQS